MKAAVLLVEEATNFQRCSKGMAGCACGGRVFGISSDQGMPGAGLFLASSPASPDTAATKNGCVGSRWPFPASGVGQVSGGGGLTFGKLAAPAALESGRGAFFGHGGRYLLLASEFRFWGIGPGGRPFSGRWPGLGSGVASRNAQGMGRAGRGCRWGCGWVCVYRRVSPRPGA